MVLKDTVGLSWLIWTGVVVKKCAPIIGVNGELLLVKQTSFTSDGKMEQEMDRWSVVMQVPYWTVGVKKELSHKAITVVS